MALTLGDARTELYELVSKNSELDPTTVGGRATLDRYLNRAYKQILSWKTPRGRLRFPAARGTRVFSLEPEVGTVASATDTTVVLTGGSAVDDYYNEYLVKITAGTGEGQTRVVVDYDGATLTATVDSEWGTNPDATSEWLVSKRWTTLSGDYRGLLKLTDITDGIDLQVSEKVEAFPSQMTTLGNPQYFFVVGGRIYFDQAVESIRWYRLEYEVSPADLTDVGETFNLPEPWEGLILLMSRWWILVRYGETEDAYAAKRDYQEMASSMSLPYESTGDRTSSGTGRLF